MRQNPSYVIIIIFLSKLRHHIRMMLGIIIIINIISFPIYMYIYILVYHTRSYTWESTHPYTIITQQQHTNKIYIWYISWCIWWHILACLSCFAALLLVHIIPGAFRSGFCVRCFLSMCMCRLYTVGKILCTLNWNLPSSHTHISCVLEIREFVYNVCCCISSTSSVLATLCCTFTYIFPQMKYKVRLKM